MKSKKKKEVKRKEVKKKKPISKSANNFRKYILRYYKAKKIATNDILKRYRKLGHRITKKTALKVLKSRRAIKKARKTKRVNRVPIYNFDKQLIKKTRYAFLRREIKDFQTKKHTYQSARQLNNNYYFFGASIYEGDDEHDGVHIHHFGCMDYNDFEYEFNKLDDYLSQSRDNLTSLEFFIWDKNSNKIIRKEKIRGYYDN
jgi:hypothetical protein